MRSRVLAVSIASAGALAVSLVGVAAGSAATVKRVRCGETQYAVNRSGSEQLGTARCGSPLGAGVLETRGSGKATGNVVTLFGTYKYFFNTGTIHGSYRVAGLTSSTLRGTVKIAGGTGAFRRTAGAGTLACHSRANSSVTRCRVVFTFTRS